MKITSVLIALMVCIAATTVRAAPRQSETADYVFKNGRVYTLDAKQHWAEAVAVKGKTIVFVGSSKGAERLIGSGTLVMDLNGRMLMPGFVDGHNHFVAGAAGKRGVNLISAGNKDAMLNLIKEYVHAIPGSPYYMGYNWNFVTFGTQEGTRQDLDAISADKPVLIFNDDNHHAWFNTKAMELAGITKDTPDPVPGSTYYKRGPDGTPSGIGIEQASWMPMAIAAGMVGGKEMLEQVMEDIFPKLPTYGITAYDDMGIFAPNLEDGYLGFELLVEWEKAGKLPVRVVGAYGIRDAREDPAKHIARLADWHKKYSSELVQVNALKIWTDGTCSSHTGVLLEPYTDAPATKGQSDWTVPVLTTWIELAHRGGFDVNMHTEGDGSLRRCLDAIEAVQKKYGRMGRRDVLHHLVLIHPDDLPRFTTLGVLADTTPVWFADYKKQEEEAINLFGQKRLDAEYMVQKKLIDAGVNTSFGSDIPGTDPGEAAPLYQIQAAVTGVVPGEQPTIIPPKERLPTLEQMLYGYTKAGAYQIHMENKIGSIEKGKLADLIVLERNLFEVPPDKLRNVEVQLTMMNGRVTWWDGERFPTQPGSMPAKGATFNELFDHAE